MRKLVLFLCLNFLWLNTGLTQPYNYLARSLAARLHYRYGQVAIVVKNLSTGQLLVRYNAKKFVIPASTQKLFTTSAAMFLLGNIRLKTFLQYDGRIADSTLWGNLYILGQGDPTLGSDNFVQKDFWDLWIKAVKKLGIKRIHGNIIADASYFDQYPVPEKWTWEDLGNYYGAIPTALCIYDNMYRIYFRTGKYRNSPTKIIKISPEIPGLKIQNFVRSAYIHSDKSYIIGAPYCYDRIAIGYLPAGRDSFIVKGSIPDPPLFLAQQLKNKLIENNIMVDGRAATTRLDTNVTPIELRKTFFIHYSPPLDSIIARTNHKSINLYAEVLLNLLGKKIAGQGTARSGLGVINRFLDSLGIDTNQVHLVDGSGLSRYNAITALSLLTLLEKIYLSQHKDEFIATLPIAGINGTLKYVGRNTYLQGRMFAKSGSMNRVRAYAGYLTNTKNQTLAFVVILNNFTCSQRQARKDIEKFLLQISQK